MQEKRQRIPQNASIAIAYTPTVSTVGLTIKHFAVDEDGTAVELASVAGSGADVAVATTLDFSQLSSVGEYRHQIVASSSFTGTVADDTNPVTLLPGTTYNIYWFDVFDPAAIT